MKTLVSTLALVSGMAFAQQGQQPGFTEAARVCRQHFSAEDQESCLARIWGKAFDLDVLPICQSHFSVHDKEDCLVAIADLRFADVAVETCREHFDAAAQQACILRFGEPRGEGPSYEDLVVRMDRAVRYIDRGRHRMARDLLWEALRAVEDGVPLP
jgi:hypothetical protein